MEKKKESSSVGSTISRQEDYRNYERVMFCMRAMGGAGDPLFTRYMHVENARTGSRIVCTDGKRLHVASISVRIPAGNYRPEARDGYVRFGKPEDVVFPAWRNVVPEDAAFKGTVSLDGLGTGTRAERDEKFSAAYCSFLSSAGSGVSMGFLRDLPCAEWRIFAQAGRRRLVKVENAADRNQFAVFVPLAA